ncbi:MAG: anaerobic ribonucleoside-triphosphate reductase [Oscillospiraceae bacterium]|nr:anaerobic ribonucleoside-triphosphate reductase [Oscillospiraceae bacterium]
MVEKKAINKDKIVGEGIGFERIRRITGYLVGTLDRFNGAKRSEVNDRVKHSIGSDKMEQL